MISTVTQLNISETSNSIDGTDGDWSFVSGEKYIYVVNNCLLYTSDAADE